VSMNYIWEDKRQRGTTKGTNGGKKRENQCPQPDSNWRYRLGKPSMPLIQDIIKPHYQALFCYQASLSSLIHVPPFALVTYRY
jgi:hypothetical protein